MSSNCIRALVLFSELSFILVFVVLKLQILARDRNALANYMQACMQFLLIDATVLKHASSSRLLCLQVSRPIISFECQCPDPQWPNRPGGLVAMAILPGAFLTR